jgi:hypothetical protein
MDRWPKHDRLSSTMRLSPATLAQAEDFLATTWRILVEDALTSPQIGVRVVGTLIDLSLRFSSAEDCRLVAQRLETLTERSN